MRLVPHSPAAAQLFLEGTIAFAEMEATGICVDEEYLRRKLAESSKTIVEMQERLRASEVGKIWLKTFGRETNLNSNQQLGRVLFDKMGYESPGETAKSTVKKKQYKTDEESLSKVPDPFIPAFIEARKLQKAVSTSLKGILTETVAGKVHCFFSLGGGGRGSEEDEGGGARSFRSSAKSPNMQNQYRRNKAMAELVRSAFIPRPGRRFVEHDFKGAEVTVAAVVTKDKRLIAYVKDPKKDMHRDMGRQIFLLPEVTKELRDRTKNDFVFREFYGGAYFSCAEDLWEDVEGLATPDGTPVRDYLRSKGIGELGDCTSGADLVEGTFVNHLKSVEDDMWQRRFKGYTQWKADEFALYQKRGWVKLVTGFVMQGYMRRNQVLNAPIQGPSFHCLLWVLIRLVNHELRKRRMKSRVVAQVHDSLLGDVCTDEFDDYVELVNRLIVVELPKSFTWLTISMRVEVEASEVNGSWFKKTPVVLTA